jgi:hypothetical protein
MKPPFLRSLALGVTIGAGICLAVSLLSGCAGKTAYTANSSVPALPPAPQRVFLSAFDAQAHAANAVAPQMTLVRAEAPPVFIAGQPPIEKRGTLSLAWDASPDLNVTGYRLHYGTNSGSYQFTADVGIATNVTLAGLNEGREYYIAATAYNADGVESDFSNEAIGVTPFLVTLRHYIWEISAWGLFGATNQLQMSENLTDWETIREFVGTENPVGVLHTSRVNAWFRVMVK